MVESIITVWEVVAGAHYYPESCMHRLTPTTYGLNPVPLCSSYLYETLISEDEDGNSGCRASC